MTTNSWKYSTTISRQLCGHSKRNLPITDRMFTECAMEMTIKGLKQPLDFTVYIYYIYAEYMGAKKQDTSDPNFMSDVIFRVRNYGWARDYSWLCRLSSHVTPANQIVVSGLVV